MALIAFAAGGIFAIAATIFSAVQIKIAGAKKKVIPVHFKGHQREGCSDTFRNTFTKIITASLPAGIRDTAKIELLYSGQNPGISTRPFQYQVRLDNGSVLKRSITRAELSRLIVQLEKKGVVIDEPLYE